MNLGQSKLFIFLLTCFGTVFAGHIQTCFLKNNQSFPRARISIWSQKFLKSMVRSLQDMGTCGGHHAQITRKLADLDIKLLRVAFLDKVLFDECQQLLQACKKELMGRSGQQGDACAQARLACADGAAQALRQVGCRGFEKEVKYIASLLDGKNMSRLHAVHGVALIADMLQHFDGVLVTEYDVIVLLHIGFVVMIIS